MKSNDLKRSTIDARHFPKEAASNPSASRPAAISVSFFVKTAACLAGCGKTPNRVAYSGDGEAGH